MIRAAVLCVGPIRERFRSVCCATDLDRNLRPEAGVALRVAAAFRSRKLPDRAVVVLGNSEACQKGANGGRSQLLHAFEARKVNELIENIIAQLGEPKAVIEPPLEALNDFAGARCVRV